MNAIPPPTEAATRELPGHDVFCTPENSEFVSKLPYQSLSTTEREIRLLKILPDSGSGFVECELLPSVKLADIEKQYSALSYCAGSASNTRPIKVNGVRSNVFANLHHALMEARHYWETHGSQHDFLLWVDQICINQFDLAERSHQVSLMRGIYEKAKETLVCLSTPGTREGGMRRLVNLSHVLKQEGRNNSVDRFNHLSLYNANTADFANSWAAYIEVSMSPWWGRAWIFQEFMVSEHTIFLHGRHSLPYPNFVRLLRSLQRGYTCRDFNPEFFNLSSDLFTDEMKIATSRMWMLLVAKDHQSSTNDLKTLLMLTKDSQATDARDKVYSLLGLVDPGYGIVPDYSVSADIHNLLVETTKRIIVFDDSLEVLCFKSRNTNRNLGELLPSWVLDWTNRTSLGRTSDLVALYDARSINSNLAELLPSWVLERTNGTSLGQMIDLGPLDDVSIDLRLYYPYRIMQTSPEALFSQVTHPQIPEAQTTVIQVWATLLDKKFHRIHGIRRRRYCFQGAHRYEIEEKNMMPIQSDYELWIVRGSRDPLLLSRYSYGYRLIRPIRCTNLYRIMDSVPGAMNDRGEIDMSKMQETRITIF
ncbi:Heterokaryon incompatibility protein [Fusarium sporotrichioides]|uniref:Heterokaryon incompatibility protein n=1 Tax=Fusarium sporotrichioides TaxID=5514 RepID=A0A395SC50_FUSSP|nr:Heterokaryon incompatibility protein [Fusarium sporotrichioides]